MKLSRRDFAASALAASVARPALAQPQRAKLALVIGNGDYDGDGHVDASPDALRRARERGFVGDLVNTWFDAVRVGEALKRAGFSVETVNNADRGMMSGAIMRHQARVAAAGPATASVLYYAGHGIQLGGRNYLVGARAQLIAAQMSDETALDRERIGMRIGVPLMMVLPGARGQTAPGYSLILIDACRDNPWEGAIRAAMEAQGRSYVGERGFGAMSVPSDRTIVCFSAQPGEMAVDGIAAASSPFAAAIARGIAAPGATVDGVLQGVVGQVAAASGARQTPWIRGRLGDGTTFAG
jgi:uncharacterized caspase-like protein